MSRQLILLVFAAACGKPAEHQRDAAPPTPPADAMIADATADAAPIDAPALPAFPVKKLEGPFPTIAAYCKSLKSEDLDAEGHHINCDTEPPFDGKRKLGKSPPFDEARIFVIEALDPHCQLGIRIGKNWYVLREAVRCLGDRAKSTLDSRVTKFAVKDGLLQLHAVYDQSTEGYSPKNFERTHFELWTVCGIGSSGVPSCTREIPVSGKREQHQSAPAGSQAKITRTKFALAPKLSVATLTLTGDTSELEQYIIEPIASGTYPLHFP